MRPSRNKGGLRTSASGRLRAALLLLAAIAGIPATGLAGPRLLDLSIRVVLATNGDARITETRQMEIDDEGTECYIVVGNLNGSELRDLTVTDETGTRYTNIGDWDIDRSRDFKAGKCGMAVSRNGGYELCWGLGQSGSRTYTTSYTVTGLLRGYPDADGFNYMFVAEGVKPHPDHVRLTIVPADTLTLSKENTGIWAFRYRGQVNLEGDSIVAESSEPFGRGSAMIVMARFEKGLFQPSLPGSGTFEQLQQRALDGSDYNDAADTTDRIVLIIIGLTFLALGFLPILYLIYVWRERRKVMKNLTWYRDIPYGGNLQKANDVLNAYRYLGTDYNNLLSACILKLIDMGAIGIELQPDGKGRSAQRFVIRELKDRDQQPGLIHIVHNIFLKAAGDDTILEPRELKSWMHNTYNQSYTDSFIQILHTKTSIYQYRDERDEVRRLYGLRKFLKEFSLLNERHVQEVALWKDYMIYATLFGIADQVIKDMKKINPEYFNMDQVARQMADDMTLPMILSMMHSSTTRAAMSKAEREARASGGGGYSSWGGGGGFSGGGFGGGVR